MPWHASSIRREFFDMWWLLSFIPGAMLGGILLGVVECICNSIPAIAPYTIAIEFCILIAILLIKPTGILGKKRREKV